VLSEQGSKRRLSVGFKAKEQVLPARQISLITSNPSTTDVAGRLGVFPWGFTEDDLKSISLKHRDWGQAWVLLSESNETLDLEDFADLVHGSRDALHCAATWLSLKDEEQDLFRFKQELISPRSLQEIRLRRQERRRQQLQQSRFQRWMTFLSAKENPERRELEPLHREWIEQLIRFSSGGLSLNDLSTELRQSLASLRLDQNRGDVRERLVTLGQLDPHQLTSMASSVWSNGFNAEHMAEAERLIQSCMEDQPGDSERTDLTDQACVTIDDSETRDIDDALGLERLADQQLRIWIHIADPGRLITPGSPLDLEARRRGSSLYLARGILPMFPTTLSTEVFSLQAGRRNAAWSTWVDLDSAGNITASGLCRSWVSPRYRLTYDDADELIDFAPPEEADLSDLHALLAIRRQWRVDRGALLMDLPEGRIRCRNDHPTVEITEPSPSREMVAEAMILCGTVAASKGIENALPLPYRSQLPAELPSAAELERLADGAVRFAAIKRCLSRGLMGTQPAAHFSLGIPAYTQATSPIRRYSDLLVQRQFAAMQTPDGGETPLVTESLEAILRDVESAIREGLSITREDQRHWQQVWFEHHSSERWSVDFLRWLRPQERLGLVRIEELAIDLAATCPSGSEPGDALLLEVSGVDSLRDQLNLVANPQGVR